MSWTNQNKIYLTSLFIARGLLLLPSELFRIVISSKIVNSSMKFKFIHKISIIQLFLVLFNLLWGPDITLSAARLGHGLCIPAIVSKSLCFLKVEEATQSVTQSESRSMIKFLSNGASRASDGAYWKREDCKLSTLRCQGSRSYPVPPICLIRTNLTWWVQQHKYN